MVTQEIAPVQHGEKEPTRPQAARRRRQGGFTLIEMLAVVVILAIVAGVGFVVVNNQIEKARVNTDIANLRTIGDAVNRYIMDKGAAPTNGMSDLVGNYLGNEPKDPWENKSYTINVTQPGTNTPGSVTIQSPHSYSSAPPNAGTGDTGLIFTGTTLKLVVNF